MASYPYVNKANKYARDVVAGKIPNCKWVKLACKRHLNDLKKSEKNKKYPYYFDKDAATNICDFAENMPHTKGKWAAKLQLIKLEPWQCFILCSIFGWKKKKDDCRRFTEAYIEVPRKNGKSILAAVVGLYCLTEDGEYGAEVYCGATTERQAFEVFRPAKKMVQRMREFREYYGVHVNAMSLVTYGDESRFEPLIGDPGDGQSPHCAIVDEYHEHKKPNLYDTMASGTLARDNPLIFIITTAGDNIEGPCFAKRSEITEILDGVLDGESTFGLIYTIDTDDDWTNPKNLYKANPNLGVSINYDQLKASFNNAVKRKNRRNNFLTKHYNLWVSAFEQWMDMEAWKRCEDKTLKIEDFKGEECYFPVDLASKIDIAASVQIFKKIIDGKIHYYIFGDYYLPEYTIKESDNEFYSIWVDDGYIYEIPGYETDYNLITDDVIEKVNEYHPEEFIYDPWQAKQMSQIIDDEGCETVEYPKKTVFMSEPMKEIEAAVRAGRIHHDGNPVLTWMISNIVCKEDANGNYFPRKQHPDKKIDGGDCVIMGVGRAMFADGTITGFVDIDEMVQE